HHQLWRRAAGLSRDRGRLLATQPPCGIQAALERGVFVSTSNQLKLLVAITMVLLSAGPAYPQEKQILQLNSDVLRLQQTVNQLQTSLDQKTQVLQKLVEKMADQVNSLTGNVDKISQTLEN